MQQDNTELQLQVATPAIPEPTLEEQGITYAPRLRLSVYSEFKVLREAKKIKAIQVIDRGGQGVPESFMKGVLRQVTKNTVLITESSEKKDDYEIQRGRIADNIKVVYYRDESGGKLRAFVLTWQ
jgi:hypothetical protein